MYAKRISAVWKLFFISNALNWLCAIFLIPFSIKACTKRERLTSCSKWPISCFKWHWFSTERFCYQFNAKCINREIIYTVFISCVKIWKIIFKHQKNGFIYEYWIIFKTIDKTHMTIMIIKEGCHHYEFLGIAALSGWHSLHITLVIYKFWKDRSFQGLIPCVS